MEENLLLDLLKSLFNSLKSLLKWIRIPSIPDIKSIIILALFIVCSIAIFKWVVGGKTHKEERRRLEQENKDLEKLKKDLEKEFVRYKKLYHKDSLTVVNLMKELEEINKDLEIKDSILEKSKKDLLVYKRSLWKTKEEIKDLKAEKTPGRDIDAILEDIRKKQGR